MFQVISTKFATLHTVETLEKSELKVCNTSFSVCDIVSYDKAFQGLFDYRRVDVDKKILA